MEFMSVLFEQVIIMFVLMFVGYLLFINKKISLAGSRDLGNILVYIIMPSVVINAYLSESSLERLKILGISFIFSFLALLVAMIVAFIFFKKNPIENFGAAFSNAGFMGIPITQAVLGTQAVFYVSAFVALLNLLQWTYGVFVITGDKRNISIKKILTNPILLSIIIGLFLYIAPFEIPNIFSRSISLLSGMNAPIAMISLGTYLAQSHLKDMLSDKTAWLCSIVRLVIIPLLTIALLSILPQDFEVLKLAILIVAATPVGSNVAIFAQIHGQDYTQAVKGVCLSTVLSIITLPLIIMLAQFIF